MFRARLEVIQIWTSFIEKGQNTPIKLKGIVTSLLTNDFYKSEKQ